MQYKVNRKENIYFIIRIVFTIALLVLLIIGGRNIFNDPSRQIIVTLTTFFIYIIMIVVFIFFQKVYLIAYMKGNGITVSEKQYEDFYQVFLQMCNDLKLRRIPKLFIIQQGGMLNAFAIRFSGSNYIAIYSDVFAIINSDIDSLKFVIGHELGHIKRMHMSKRFWTCLSSIVPFLGAAYSRSCEYTCDNIGFSLTNRVSKNALVLLAAGKELYKSVNIESYIEDAKKNNTIAVKIMELFMSHPYLPKRLRNVERNIDHSA